MISKEGILSLTKKFLVLITSLLLLTSCSASLSKEKDNAIERASEAFEDKGRNPNHDLETFSLYLPAGMEVESSDNNNILLNSGSNMYILFINPNEGPKSKVIYESTLASTDDFAVNEQFENEDKFGYVLVREVDEEVYEVTVGIGGTKLTTETELNDIDHEAGLMMEIISSIEPKEK